MRKCVDSFNSLLCFELQFKTAVSNSILYLKLKFPQNSLLCLNLQIPKVYYVLNCSFQQSIMFKTDVSNSLRARNLANTIIQNIEKRNVKLILAHKTEAKKVNIIYTFFDKMFFFNQVSYSS